MANEEQVKFLMVDGPQKWNHYRDKNLGVPVDLSGADLSFADLNGANLRHVNLTGATLSGTNLTGADLTEADLSDAEMVETNLSGAELSDSILCRANMSGANLSYVNLLEVDLSEVNLSMADLYKAHLFGANLSGADLSNAKLGNAKFSKASLKGANLSGVDLREVKNLTQDQIDVVNFDTTSPPTLSVEFELPTPTAKIEKSEKRQTTDTSDSASMTSKAILLLVETYKSKLFDLSLAIPIAQSLIKKTSLNFQTDIERDIYTRFTSLMITINAQQKVVVSLRNKAGSSEQDLIVEEGKLETIKTEIRERTDGFSKCFFKGDDEHGDIANMKVGVYIIGQAIGIPAGALLDMISIE